MYKLGHECTRDFDLINCLESHVFGNFAVRNRAWIEVTENPVFREPQATPMALIVRLFVRVMPKMTRIARTQP